jgi:hypothetical protein
MEKYNFINGSFSKEEALDIINSVIQSKIKFHHVKSMSDFEKGLGHETSKNRISELKEMQQAIAKQLNSNGTLEFKITGEIKIESL